MRYASDYENQKKLKSCFMTVFVLVVGITIVLTTTASMHPSEFSFSINGITSELGSTKALPLDKINHVERKDDASREIIEIDSYDGFNIIRDGKIIITIDILEEGASTYRGITVGMSKEEVLKSYPEIIPEEQRVKGLWYEDGDSRIDFYFDDNGTLTEIIIYNNKL